MSCGGRLQPAGGHPGHCGGHRWLVGGRHNNLGGGEAVEWVAHYGSQDVQLGGGEIVGMEANGPPETLVGGRRALGVDILCRLQESVDKIR